MSALSRLERAATRTLEALLGLGLIVMVLVNVANAAGRYGGLPTLTGADELLVYGMIWIVMVGAILTVRRREHLAINLLSARLAVASRRVVLISIDLVTILVCAFVAWHSLDFVQRIGAIGQTSMGLGIPMVIPHAAVTVGFGGMAAVAALLLAADLIGAHAGRMPEARPR